MAYHRFEMAFDNIPQKIGFLQGLGDVGLTLKEEADLLELFQSLPCPNVNHFPSEFWFTEAGLERYATAILKIGKAIGRNNWQLMYRKMDRMPKAKTEYMDKWQAAWDPREIRSKATNPCEVIGMTLSIDGRVHVETNPYTELDMTDVCIFLNQHGTPVKEDDLGPLLNCKVPSRIKKIIDRCKKECLITTANGSLMLTATGRKFAEIGGR